MKFRMSMFGDAFQGSGVPVAGDPITTFELVPVLGLRVATVLENCRPMLRDVVKVRFIATNFGQKPLQIVRSVLEGTQRDDVRSENSSITLLPGESSEFSTFRSWDVTGEYQLTMAYEARCTGLPFARLHYPSVAIHVRPPLMPWMLRIRAPQPQAQ